MVDSFPKLVKSKRLVKKPPPKLKKLDNPLPLVTGLILGGLLLSTATATAPEKKEEEKKQEDSGKPDKDKGKVSKYQMGSAAGLFSIGIFVRINFLIR